MNYKCDREQFIEKSIGLFGKDAFDYSKVNYINSRTEIVLICKEHGEFRTTPTKHLKMKCGCPECSLKFRGKKISMTNDDYKKLVEKLHGDKYDLSKVEYNGMRNFVTAVCPKHGEFTINAFDFVNTRGCPKCGRLNKTIVNKNVTHTREKLTTEAFVEKARKIHGDKYDYSKIEYKNAHTKVCIICPIHGEFWQIPISHLKGYGCQKCGKESMAKTQSMTTESFIEKAKRIHQDKYDYSQTVYNGCYGKIKIICPKHGEFEQKAYVHMSGHGCPKCMAENSSRNLTFTTEQFIEKAKKAHPYEKHDYSNVEYKGAHSYVKLICEKGHTYYQKASKHLLGQGCPQCNNNISKAEKEIVAFITDIGFECLTNERDILPDGKEIDIYVPSKNIAIEFDGLYWHNETKHPQKNYHLNKTIECEKQGIRLIHIFEDEWNDKKEIVLSRLKNILGVIDTKIFARKCAVRIIDNKTASEFLDANHIQGKVNSSIRYGLYYDNELVSLMTFGKLRKCLGNKGEENEYELLRFCNKLNTIVIGGASKLFKKFIDGMEHCKVISYSDRRWNTGNLYENLGFKYTHSSSPNYSYVIGLKRHNRFQFRKDVLVKEGFDSDKSEHEIMLGRGIYRIYDCGCLCFEFNKD